VKCTSEKIGMIVFCCHNEQLVIVMRENNLSFHVISGVCPNSIFIVDNSTLKA
jgi:hypothetical protein